MSPQPFSLHNETSASARECALHAVQSQVPSLRLLNLLLILFVVERPPLALLLVFTQNARVLEWCGRRRQRTRELRGAGSRARDRHSSALLSRSQWRWPDRWRQAWRGALRDVLREPPHPTPPHVSFPLCPRRACADCLRHEMAAATRLMLDARVSITLSMASIPTRSTHH